MEVEKTRLKLKFRDVTLATHLTARMKPQSIGVGARMSLNA
jgi:hypothetical protein